MNRMFVDELLKDEKILWAGQPDPSIVFSPADKFLIPFSLIWGGGSFIGVYTSLRYDASIFSILFGIPFAFIGLYLIFGRFIYKNWRKRITYYAVTNQRILILTNSSNKHIKAAFISNIPVINKKTHKNNLGTITFGNVLPYYSSYNNTGLDFFSSPYMEGPPSFYDIKGAEDVYHLVNELRRK